MKGCAYCHTEQVRFVAADQERWGQPIEAWETRYEYPHLWGTRRIGPDLARESGVHSNDWQLMHLFDPRAVVAASNMPRFPWLFAGSPERPTQEALDLLAYIQSLGRPRQLAGYDSDHQRAAAPVLLSGADPVLIQRGSWLFHDNCAPCHGDRGQGDGVGAEGLFPRPANLSVIEYSTPRLSSILWNGIPGSAMPRWNRLSTSDLQAVAAYTQTIDASGSHEAGNESTVIEQGRDLYRENCTGCHGTDGRGNGPAAAALAPSPTNFHQERPGKAHAVRVLNEGIPGTAMPTWRAELSDTQREAVAEYVDSLYERVPSTR